MKFILLIAAVLAGPFLMAQDLGTYTTSGAHSHNDYEQRFPFWSGYYQHFGSMEADVFLKNDTLFVAHNAKDMRPERTLSSLYLNPLLSQIRKNQGTVYPNSRDTLQLLIDLKTPARETMPGLVKELAKYEDLLVPKGLVKIVLSGNVPSPSEFSEYPPYIFFDGRPEVAYTPAQYARIGLISQAFGHYSPWNGKGVLTKGDKLSIEKVIKQVHGQGKKIRFWATPDDINAWKMFMNLGVDYINTDKVDALGQYLRNRSHAEYRQKEAHSIYKPAYRNNDVRGKVKNVILLIGDGMGLAQIHAGLTANRGVLNLSQILNIGFSKTSSSDSYITDSAAGGTAMATGHKTRNRAIGVDSNLVAVPNLPDQLKPLGIRTALISAGSVTDATPAAFFAHQPYRDYEKQIAHDFLRSSVDILIGGGSKIFNDEKIGDSLQLAGFQYSNNWEDISRVKAPFVLLNDVQTVSVRKGRGAFLTEAFRHSVRSLEKNKNGFFMMAEGAQIDYGGHAKNVPYVVTEMLDFDKLVGEAMKFADSNGETLVIITADHETGGLTLLDGNMKNGYVDGHFSTNDHTGIMVPVFAYGPHSLDFRGVYENTEIHRRILQILKSRGGK